MNILFICGSLEYGKDGVGDYVRLLSAQLLTEGHKATVIALNDGYISSPVKEVQISKEIKICCYRIPSKESALVRLDLAKSFIKKINPEWISLQYVGFSYHKYGTSMSLFLLKNLIGNRKLHMMLHELWCGMSKNAGFKEKVMGKAQNIHLRALIKILNPQSIFTSIEPYAKELRNLKIESITVPIFSNIDIKEQGTEEDYLAIISKLGLTAYLKKPDDFLILGFFGTVYYRSGLKDLLETVIRATDKLNKKLLIISVGNNRTTVLEKLAEQPSVQVPIIKSGALEAGMVNRMIKLFDLGVLTTKANCLNKSGTGIALMDRDIPILISSEDKTYSELDKEIKEGMVYQINGIEDVLNAITITKSVAKNNRLNNSARSYINL